MTGASNVNVRMDKAEINGTQTGLRGFFPENVELISPEIKVGDRVTYVGKSGPAGFEKPYSPNSRGVVTGLTTLGTNNHPSANVDWETIPGDPYFIPPSTAWLSNLEIITMSKTLDLSQPLVLLTRGGDPKPVKFLAKTDDGDLMVDTIGTGKDSHWMQFTADGTFLRAARPGGSASALKLVNEEPKVTHRFTAQLVDGAVFFSPHQGSVACDVQVTTQGDKIVSIVAKS